jgi:hypothetical protein
MSRERERERSGSEGDWWKTRQLVGHRQTVRIVAEVQIEQKILKEARGIEREREKERGRERESEGEESE